MTYAELSSDVTFLTGGVTTTEYTAAQRTIGLNSWYQKVVTMILASQDEWDWDDINHTTYPIATANLVANQQDYTLPASLKILKLKRVEVKIDNSTWRKAEPFDINERSSATDTTTVANDFSTAQSFYDVQHNALFLYPVPAVNVTGGIKMWFTREIDEFTTADTTQEPGIDEAFHRMLSLGAALDWEMSKKPDGPRAKWLQDSLRDFELRLRQHYGDKQQDRKYTLKPAYVDYH